MEGEIIIDISIDELLKEILPGLTEENIDFDKGIGVKCKVRGILHQI